MATWVENESRNSEKHCAARTPMTRCVEAENFCGELADAPPENFRRAHIFIESKGHSTPQQPAVTADNLRAPPHIPTRGRRLATTLAAHPGNQIVTAKHR
jgi:hypothetical protein